MATADENFIKEGIWAHNELRARHNAPPLTHDPELSKAAQKWADQIAKSGKFQHSTDRKNAGENIAMKWTSTGELMSGLLLIKRHFIIKIHND